MHSEGTSRRRLGATFEEVAELYDEIRPRYPQKLLDDLLQLSEVPKAGRILEVGAGTGIATLPLAERGYDITAIEPGNDLAAVARRKLSKKYANTKIVVSTFEDWPLPDEPFDVVASATAWHWIDPEVGYRKAAKALRHGGALAIFGYKHIAGGSQEFFEQVQDCYLRHMPGTKPGEHLQDPADYQTDTTALEASGLFEHPEIRTYLNEETYNRSEYLDLLSTYSGHRALTPEARASLFDCVDSLINRFGGQVHKHYIHELVVAKRKN